MRRCLRAHGSAFVIALILCLVVLGCDYDKPTEPGPVADYPVYFWDGVHEDWVFRYHPQSNTVDSIQFPVENIVGLTVSADGQRVYVACIDSVLVMDTNTDQIAGVIPYASWAGVSVSPDNQLIAVGGDDLFIIRADDYSVVFHDTSRVSTQSGHFSRDSKSYFAPFTPAPQEHSLRSLYSLHFGSDTVVTRKAFAGSSVGTVVPILDATRLLIYFKHEIFVSSFAVYDISDDAIIFQDVQTPGAGIIVVTPDERFAFYSNPGTLQISPTPPPSAFTCYDISANSIHATISTLGVVNGNDSLFLPIGDLAITADGQRLVGAAPDGFDVLVSLDIPRLQIVDYYELGGPRLLHYLSCQASLM